MEIETTLRWPVAPGQVVAARCDPTYLDLLCRRTGALEHEVTVVGLQTVVRRVMPTDRFPDFARKLTGERLTLVETTTWQEDAGADSSRRAQIRLRVDGAPLTSTTTTTITAEGDGSLEHTVGTLTAKVPLIGGRIEKAVKPALEAGAKAQVDTYLQWVDERG